MSVGLLGLWLLRALTAAMSAAVASTCAKRGFTLVDGRCRILMPAVVGSWCHAAVRPELLVLVSDLVSTNSSRGDTTSVLQLRSACVNPATADMTSNSIAVGLDMVFKTPTMA